MCVRVPVPHARQLFAAVDTDGDGLVSLQEFLDMLDRVGLGSITKDEGARLFAAIDSNGTGSIDYAEFLAAFRVKVAGRGSTKVQGWEAAIVEQVGVSSRCDRDL